MMERLVDLLREGGARRVDELAREMETTPQLVELMLNDLARMGILRQADKACSRGCAGCSLAGKCTSGSGVRSWALTETR